MSGEYFQPWQLIVLATVQCAALICDIWWFDRAQRLRKEWF